MNIKGFFSKVSLFNGVVFSQTKGMGIAVDDDHEVWGDASLLGANVPFDQLSDAKLAKANGDEGVRRRARLSDRKPPQV